MNTPRWFYAVLAGCAVVLTLAASLALLSDNGRYESVEAGAVLDTRTGTVCFVGTSTPDGPNGFGVPQCPVVP